MKCLLCSGDTELFFSSRRAVSVTSDCRLLKIPYQIYRCCSCGHFQKRPDSIYHKNLREITDSYSIYELSGGTEQLMFSDDGAVSRSDKIISAVRSVLSGRASLLDIGTGAGTFPAALKKMFPEYRVTVHDVHDNQIKEALETSGAVDYYIGSISGIRGSYEVISMVHVLEHVPEPLEFLGEIKTLMKKDGVLLIQVPDFNYAPFDAAIYDHVSHYVPQVLEELLRRFFRYVYLPENMMEKEITLAASDEPLDCGVQDTDKTLLPETGILEASEGLESVQGKVSVFGASTAGVYCAGLLGGKCGYFLDEDSSKTGKVLGGIEIIHPADLSAGERVFVPFTGETEKRIKQKYSSFKYIDGSEK